jgi:tellurite resistance protein TerB
MSFIDKAKAAIKGATTSLTEDFARFKNKDVLNATVGACVIVAAADGRIDQSEKSKTLGLIQNSDLTKVYSMVDVVSVFEAHTKRFDFDVDHGRSEALRIIGAQRKNPDVARSIVRGAVIIGKADGDFDAKEKQAVALICRELGLNESDFL